MRLLVLKLTATLALWMCGCGLPLQPMPSPQPQPTPIVTPTNTTHTIKLEIGQDGKIQLVGGADINLKQPAGGGSTPSGQACDCGNCNHASTADCGPDCPRRAILRTSSPSSGGQGCPPQLFSALRDSKPVVEMLSDFDAGQCGACDLAWNDWLANGKDWPFVLVKKRGAGGRTSPTFVMPGGKAWSPSSYSVGGLAEYWRTNK